MSLSQASGGEDRVQHAIRVAYDSKAKKQRTDPSAVNDSHSDASPASDSEQESEANSEHKVDRDITVSSNSSAKINKAIDHDDKKSKKRARDGVPASRPESHFEPDAFFIEETTDDNKNQLDHSEDLPMRAQTYKSNSRVMRFPRGKIQHEGKRSGEPTKQESRLRAWQQGRRGRGRSAGGRIQMDDSSRRRGNVG